MNSQEITSKDEMTGRQRKQLITSITNALDATKQNVESIVDELKLTNTQAQGIIEKQNFNKEQLRASVKELILKNFTDERFSTHIIDCNKSPFIPFNWLRVEEHIKCGQFTWNPEKVKFFLSANQKEGTSIEGNDLRKELKNKPVMNANLLDYLLDHPHLIPPEWRFNKGNFRYIYFWGTIYTSHAETHFDHKLFVRYLCFKEGHWKDALELLGNDFDFRRPACVFDK